MKLSLRSKILLLVFALIAVPVLVLGINSYITSRTHLTENIRISARNGLASGIDVADIFLKSVEDAVVMLSSDPSMQNVLRNPQEEDRVLAVFEAYVRSHADIENAYYGTGAGNFYVYPPAVGGLPPGFNPTTRPWYQLAVESGRIAWTEPYIDTGSGKLVVSVVHPVQSSQNSQILGVVGIDVTLDSLSAILSTTSVGQTGYLVMIDNTGLILAHPKEDVIGTRLGDTDELYNMLLASQWGELDFVEDLEEKFIAFTALDRTNWLLGAMISYDEANVHIRSQLLQTLLIGAALLVIAFGCAIIFANRLIINPVSRLVGAAEEIGKGNFTIGVDLHSSDELGILANTFRKLQQDLGKLIGQIISASDTTAELSRSVFRSSQEISASTEEMAATTSQFASSVQQLSDRVQHIDEYSTTVQTISREGEDLVQKAVSQMSTVESSFSSLYQSVEELSVQSAEIGKITDIIRGISDQTNLLALNAAIEAARAGEQGRGFAVVAEEVRTLAEQTGRATEQIATLLQDVYSRIDHVRNEADGSLNEVKVGSDSVQVAGRAFGDIREAINNISTRIQEVASYALELSSGSEEMAAATEEQAATLQSITSSANELAEHAELLMQITEEFTI